ncbi:helicase-primase helicase subunit [Anguillid herpesvirus 1]|uniref:DNA helicase n=1 Tax=Anguillid herpesvirus 1 TaxID=150286 RepID=E5DCU5_9VIRU|nr:helicase-primase helicase subunit [Anguillid herpesvirus 1]ADA57800.1 helicase-primase helicase subunit [Anguillid herpesvirus 1]ADQ54119.1 DNA helicase [Anguillid herpesvirus 1]APD76200.1 helicase-primase helicase subunit [Anguillid herpesvirus 1]QRM16330.1 helicase-primase helicase subunit [Anguillid herpesvirus 1]QRM16589.1 helicase-primase helicase subunit [Anguillid herpesvirus 1]
MEQGPEPSRIEMEELSTSSYPPAEIDRLTTYSRLLQIKWVSYIFSCLALPIKEPLPVVLSGDAGAGKTKAITLIRDKLRKSPFILTTGASTVNVAAMHNVRTLHSILGVNTAELLREDIPLEQWFSEWCTKYTAELTKIDAARTAYIANPDHACPKIILRCEACSRYVFKYVAGVSVDNGEMRDKGCWPLLLAPATTPAILVDEFGMMHNTWLTRVFVALKRLAPPGDAHVLILVGSVTQLPPAHGKDQPKTSGSNKEGPWVNELLSQTRFSFHLPFSMRMKTDFEYGECLGMMQYNASTPLNKRIMDSRVDERALDNTYNLDWPRIIHADAQVDQFNSLAKQRLASEGKKTWTLTPLIQGGGSRGSGKGEAGIYRELRTRFRHMSVIKQTISESQLVVVLKYGDAARFPGSLGRVVNYDEKAGNLLLESLETGSTFEVSRVGVVAGKASASLWPIKSGHAMNTYFCQGLTMPFKIVYCPPKAYHMSPIKASAYVACSRVTNRANLYLSNSNFAASKRGKTEYFEESAIRFKILIEQGYIPLL